MFFKYKIIILLANFLFLNISYIQAQDTCRSLAGLSIDFEKINENKSIPVCLKAIKDEPDNIENWHFLGRSYSKAEKFDKSIIWIRKAAEEGYAPSQNNLGVAYEFGEGVEQDYK